MLKLFFSNRYEQLKAQFLQRFGQVQHDIWAQRQVIIPNAAVRRDLELSIAQSFGICAQVEMTYFAQWLWQQIGRVVSLPAHAAYDAEQLTWQCFNLLRSPITPLPERLQFYLKNADALMYFELAQRIAKLFEHYLTYRPQWLATWQHGEHVAGLHDPQNDQLWQAWLWQQLAPTERLPALDFLQKMTNADASAWFAGMPPIAIFVLPSMPPLHLRMLTMLSMHRDIDLYVLNPCREYWFDVLPEIQVARLKRDQKWDYQEVGHPLLAQWGRQTQAYLTLLNEQMTHGVQEEAAIYQAAEQTHCLAQLQNGMLNLTNSRIQKRKDDCAIEVHACHSLTRQLEVLRDRLLFWFEQDPTLKPADVLVVTPQLSQAAPYIDAVFGLEIQPFIPYCVTGLAVIEVNPIAQLLLRWLTLHRQQVTAAELMEWWRLDLLQTAFQLNLDELDQVQSWLIEAGAKQGLSAAQSDVIWDKFSIEDALNRLFLAYAMTDWAEPIAGCLASGKIQTQQSQWLSKITRFVEQLSQFEQQSAQAKTAEAWWSVLNEQLLSYFSDTTQSNAWLLEVREILDEWRQAAGVTLQETLLDVEVLHHALQQRFYEASRGGVPWGCVTFSALTSLRYLPYRVVCLIDMNQGVLPTQIRADEFDLIADNYYLGDRQRRDDERNLFLDLLLAARQQVFISYNGRHIRDNTALSPASLVDELLDYLVDFSVDEQADMMQRAQMRASYVTEHPLHAFSPYYFKPQASCVSYRQDQAHLANLWAQPRVQSAFLKRSFDVLSVDRLMLLELIQFWQSPTRAFLKQRLGVNLFLDEAILDEAVPFQLEQKAQQQMIQAHLAFLLTQPCDALTLQTVRRRLFASPASPVGATGAIYSEQVWTNLRQLMARLPSDFAMQTKLYTLSLDCAKVQLPSTLPFSAEVLAASALPLQLQGVLSISPAHGQCLYYCRAKRETDVLIAWLKHLFYCAIGAKGVTTVFFMDETMCFQPVQHAAEMLAMWVRLYRLGFASPLKFFVKSSFAFVQKGEAQALEKWQGAQRTRAVRLKNEKGGLGERFYEENQLVWRDAETLLTPDFFALASAVLPPLFDHLTEEKHESASSS